MSEKDGNAYRLPTEAEWEYACRAGTTTPFHFGDMISTDQANYDGQQAYGKGREGIYREQTMPVGGFALSADAADAAWSVYRAQTMPVGSFPANSWGLYDMHGNVWEWCADGFEPYTEKDLTDPQERHKDDGRVVRGGSWFYAPRYCRSAYRRRFARTNQNDDVGLRVCLCLG